MQKVLSEDKKPCGACEPKKRVDLEKLFSGVSFRQVSESEIQTMTDGVNHNMVGSDVIAALFGITTRRVQQLTKDGIITGKRVRNSNKYDLLSTVQQYIKYLSEKANARGEQRDRETEERKQTAEADFKRHKADLAELQLKEYRGDLHRGEDVEAVMTDMALAIRSMMMALPSRLATEISKTESTAAVAQTIKKGVYEVLEQLANYQYDPEEFEKRVRQRKGLQELVKDEKDE